MSSDIFPNRIICCYSRFFICTVRNDFLFILKCMAMKKIPANLSWIISSQCWVQGLVFARYFKIVVWPQNTIRYTHTHTFRHICVCIPKSYCVCFLLCANLTLKFLYEIKRKLDFVLENWKFYILNLKILLNLVDLFNDGDLDLKIFLQKVIIYF